MEAKDMLNTMYEIVEKAKKYDELINHPKNGELHCSFCHKGQEDVYKIVAGSGVYICDECIQVCHDIIFGEIKEDNITVETDVNQNQI